MLLFFAIFHALTNPHVDELARGAQRTAPAYLSPEQAHEHAYAAVVAGEAYNIDPALLLSIAWHESRYVIASVQPEVGGRVSCGVMSPEPIEHCAAPSLLGGYLTGAAHLRGWLDATRDVRHALLGYGGGYRLIAFCDAGGEARGCHVPEVFLGRAAWIVRAGVGPGV